MAEYRAYSIGNDGHFVNSTPIICEDDRQAIEKARQVAKGHIVEVWSGERFVARLEPED